MKTTNINHLLEYLSLIFVLSYFFLHNIHLVIVGIIFSFYLINTSHINSTQKELKKNIVIKKVSNDLYQNNKELESDIINAESTRIDSDFTLVETVEELGFIPTIEKNDQGIAA